MPDLSPGIAASLSLGTVSIADPQERDVELVGLPSSADDSAVAALAADDEDEVQGRVSYDGVRNGDYAAVSFNAEENESNKV